MSGIDARRVQERARSPGLVSDGWSGTGGVPPIPVCSGEFKHSSSLAGWLGCSGAKE